MAVTAKVGGADVKLYVATVEAARIDNGSVAEIGPWTSLAAAAVEHMQGFSPASDQSCCREPLAFPDGDQIGLREQNPRLGIGVDPRSGA